MKANLMQAVVSLLVTLATLTAYHELVVRPSQRIGIVDVGEVYRKQEEEFAKLLTRSASAGERERAYAMAKAFSRQLPLALEELPRDCDCLVVLRNAVAAPSPRTVDLTSHLQRKLEAR
ncbi:hypothetical protein [Aquabacterium humicola]|uniref:hypothetical protein n=1 Tax=Aquabacterium humicola TaxID=3237377 RepID=UPI00254334F4|nr:hypothetical protein [Rubrivivax pictus]